jgi:hypothetical protein
MMSGCEDVLALVPPQADRLALSYLAVYPPSTIRLVPVTQRAAFESRKTQAAAKL